MGSSSSQQHAASEETKAAPEGTAASTAKKVNIMLLGPPGTGKTAFLKQLQVCFCGGYTAEQRVDFRRDANKALLTALHYLSQIQDDEVGARCSAKTSALIAEKISPACDKVSGRLAVEVRDAVFEAWTNDAGMQALAGLLNRAVLQPPSRLPVEPVSPALRRLVSSMPECILPGIHFLKKIEMVMADDYVPSNDDIVRLGSSIGTESISFEAEIRGERLAVTVTEIGWQLEQEKLGSGLATMHEANDADAQLFILSPPDFIRSTATDGISRLRSQLDFLSNAMAPSALRADVLTFVAFNKNDILSQALSIGEFGRTFKSYQGDNWSAKAVTAYLQRRVAKLMLGAGTNPCKKLTERDLLRVAPFIETECCALRADAVKHVVLKIVHSVQANKYVRHPANESKRIADDE